MDHARPICQGSSGVRQRSHTQPPNYRAATVRAYGRKVDVGVVRMRFPVGTSSVSRLLAGPRDVAGAALMRVFKAWAGLPSGPLGWAGSRAMPVIHGPLYQVMGDALQLRPDDELLDVACGSGVFLARQARPVHHVAGVDLSDVQIALAHRRLGDRMLGDALSEERTGCLGHGR
jgi:hypothetical protein